MTLYTPTYGTRRTLVGAMAVDGRKALSVLERGFRIPTFLEFVREKLLPMLRADDIVVMDNLRIHKNAEARALIEAAGAMVLFQPPYSPEFNAIEFCWGWVKQDLRRTACRTIDALVHAVKKRWDAVNVHLCQKWASGCGYPLPVKST